MSYIYRCIDSLIGFERIDSFSNLLIMVLTNERYCGWEIRKRCRWMKLYAGLVIYLQISAINYYYFLLIKNAINYFKAIIISSINVYMCSMLNFIYMFKFMLSWSVHSQHVTLENICFKQLESLRYISIYE